MVANGRCWLPGTLVGVVVVAGAALALFAAHRLGRTYLLTVTPGVLHRSGQLTPDELRDVALRYGIRTVVDLRSENEMTRGDWHAREAAVLADLGVALVDLPMDTGHPPRDDQLGVWLDLLDDPAAHPILVHCEYGVVRTGIMVGVYDIERSGVRPDAALARFELFGGDVPERIRSRIEGYHAAYVPRRPGG